MDSCWGLVLGANPFLSCAPITIKTSTCVQREKGLAMLREREGLLNDQTCTCTCIYACRYMYIHVDACTVQLTRNLNASVEYEHFYSRVSMCETRALEHSYSSFTRRSDPSHSSTRALVLVLVLERSSTRTRLERCSTSTRLELARIRAMEHRTRRY